MQHFYQCIVGWCDFEDLYAEAVRRAPSDTASSFVEVGVCYGRSAAFMAVEIENSGKEIRQHLVDKWSDEAEYHFVNRAVGEPFDCALYRGDSAEAADYFDDGSVDFCFIDADHSYEGVKRDILAWLPKVADGGAIGGHDHTAEFPGVVVAVAQIFGSFAVHRGTSWYMSPEALTAWRT